MSPLTPSPLLVSEIPVVDLDLPELELELAPAPEFDDDSAEEDVKGRLLDFPVFVVLDDLKDLVEDLHPSKLPKSKPNCLAKLSRSKLNPELPDLWEELVLLPPDLPIVNFVSPEFPGLSFILKPGVELPDWKKLKKGARFSR
jgi:hypothetical protein